MQISFSKYHGAGNDFIIINDFDKKIGDRLNSSVISSWCSRRFGVGADGLILIQEHGDLDFDMVYYNSDGNLSSMCGNGGRCSAWFAYLNELAQAKQCFQAVDGAHKAECLSDLSVNLEMRPVRIPEKWGDDYLIDTGSPHYVRFVDDIDMDVVKSAREIRYSNRFKDKGINVNFVQINDGGLSIRTYERGVEDETLACGTGVTAAALVWSYLQPKPVYKICVKAVGGDLQVKYGDCHNFQFSHVWLSGPVAHVFDGVLDIKA